MKKTVFVLSLLVLLLGGWVAALWLLPFAAHKGSKEETRYGVNEGLELVEQKQGAEGKRYIVEDEDGKQLFIIPLRNCLLDTRYRNGQLRFREKSSGREGYIDRQGMVTFVDNQKGAVIPENTKAASQVQAKFSADLQANEQATEADLAADNNTENNRGVGGASNGKGEVNGRKTGVSRNSKAISQVDLKTMAQSNPFYKEASKIMQGKLNEIDAKRRHMILNYCEHFRTAYTTKDIDFLRQVFSDKALIIVGNVIKPATNDNKCQAEPKVTYAIHSKRDYIARLSKVFAANQKIDVKFSGFRIMRHPTMDGIYGVTLRQQYKSDRYCDDGYLFLLWDFRDKSMPLIHVRTWQPAQSIGNGNEVISMQDFNLE